MILIKGEYYRNKKNKQRYQFIGYAFHSETLEDMVIYQAMYDNFYTWVRPLDLFMEKFEPYLEETQNTGGTNV